MFFLAVLAGLLVCVVLPVRAQKKTGKLCFPLDTTQYRVSDGYGWRQDPFTGERTFHKLSLIHIYHGCRTAHAGGGNDTIHLFQQYALEAQRCYQHPVALPSELYTDYSFITADHGIGEEASNVFQNLAVQKLTEERCV